MINLRGRGEKIDKKNIKLVHLVLPLNSQIKSLNRVDNNLL